MAKHYIVDGYNVIFSTNLKELGMERARGVLSEIAGLYVPDKVTIVYDGQVDVEGFTRPGVVFTKGEKADDYIKRMIERSKDRQRLVIVTRDKSIIGYAKYMRCKVLDPKRFVENPPRAAQQRLVKGVLTPKQVEFINRELAKAWGIDDAGGDQK